MKRWTCRAWAGGWLVWAGLAAAGAVEWPSEWLVFGPVDIPASADGWPERGHPDRAALLPDDLLKRMPAELTIGGVCCTGRTMSADSERRLDFGARFGEVRRGQTVYVFAPVRVEQDTVARLGVGADWWMHWWLNGKPVFDTLAAGNKKTPVTTANYQIELPLKAGENVLAAAVIGGSAAFQLTAGDPAAEYVQRMASGRDLYHKVASLRGSAAMAARAREEFEAAARLAGTDTEKAAALLGLAEAWQVERLAPDRDRVRRLCQDIAALTNAGPAQQGDAALLAGDAWRDDGQWERARDAYARAAAVSSRPGVAPAGYTATLYARKGHSAAARAFLREGRYDDARKELRALLDVDAHSTAAEAQRRQWQAETEQLLELIDLVEIWNTSPEPVRLEASGAARGPGEPPAFVDVMRALRRDRPRLFLTRDTLDRVKREGLTPEQQAWLAELKRRVDRYPEPPVLDDAARARMLSEEGKDRHGRVMADHWGYYAAHAALVWLLTEDRAYFERAAAFLEHAATTWDAIYTGHQNASSRVFHRINALSAYDWLYNELPAGRRQAIGRMLFPALHNFYTQWRVVWGSKEPDDPSGYGIGYTDVVMGWYLGLAFLGAECEGLDTDLCLDAWREGYRRHAAFFRMLEASPDSVPLRGAIGYFTQGANGPFNFLDSYRAATGDDFARYVPKRAAGDVSYALWNTIAPTRHPQLTYGWSDMWHINNHMEGYRLWLLRAPDLYAGIGDHVDLEALAALARFQWAPAYEPFLDTENYLTPASPLLMARRGPTDEQVAATLARVPRARHFPDPIGQTFMNSGWGSNDTYAVFIAGRRSPVRKHLDENHFTIYQQGFLAMDTGAQIANTDPTRPDDEQAARRHQSNYYMDTIAHNSVLIHMEGETFPGFWGHPATVNSGGMRRNHGARVLAFETDALATYLASDATSCYHTNKAAEVIRQFLFVYPDWFVVFDRVESKAAGQKKTWLFHTQHEPVETGGAFRAEHWDGAVCVRTLLPRDARAETIGGPGREFWVGDRNFPPNRYMSALMADAEGNPTPDRHLFGQWRLDISPAEARTRDLFLHLIQVGDKAALTAVTPSTLIEDEQTAGVEFQAGPRTVRVVFRKAGEVGGHIRIAEGGAVLADRPLAGTVQKQEGLALAQ